VKTTLFAQASAVLAAALLLGASGCAVESNAASPSADGTGNAPLDTGSVNMNLIVSGGAQIATVTYTISGPNGAATVVATNTVNVKESGGVSVVVPLIPAGSGYRVVLSAEAVDGGVGCEGSAPFDIMPHVITQVQVQMACSAQGAGAQQTLITGQSFDCAAWDSVTASPTQTNVGSSISITAVATAPSLSNLTYAWSAPSGQFSAANQAVTQFTCTQPGPVPVTLTVADGPVPAGSSCNPALTTDTITVTCGSGGVPTPATPAWALGLLALGIAGIGLGRGRRSAAG
jgi:hypothetical protein